MRGARRLAALLLGISVALAALLPARADAAPATFVNGATAFRNLGTSDNGGDLFVLVRGELPLETDAGGAAWCAQLTDTTGCELDPPTPAAPESLEYGMAFVRLYTGSAISDEERPPRVGHFLAGLYLGSGHGITWGDATAEVCLEADNPPFNPPASTCFAVLWNSAASDQSSQRAELGEVLRTELRNLENALALQVNTLVSNRSLITTEGQVYTRELPLAVERILPAIFTTGSTKLLPDDVTPAAGDPPLQTELDGDVEATQVREDLVAIGREYLGTRGYWYATFAVLGIGFAAAAIMGAITHRTELSVAAFFIPPIVGAMFRLPPIQYVLTAGFVLTFPSAAYLVTRFKGNS